MPRNLLLADDSITIQKVVGITFAGEDFTIISVDNGEDAVRKAKELRPDVILADVVMPKKNGYEVCEAIKGDPGLKHIPVLLLAGTFEAFDESRARAAHADGHIAKPFESQALINKVRELLERTAPAAASSPPVILPTTIPPAPPTLTASLPAPPAMTIPPAPALPVSFDASVKSTSAPPGFASSVAPGSSVRTTPPVLTRHVPPPPPPPPAQVAVASQPRPEVRPSAPPGASITDPPSEETFEDFWTRDEGRGPSAAAEGSASLSEPVAAPNRTDSGDLDWAALGLETDVAAARPPPAPARSAAPAGAVPTPTPTPPIPAGMPPSSVQPVHTPEFTPVKSPEPAVASSVQSPELLPFGEPIDLADLEVEELAIEAELISTDPEPAAGGSLTPGPAPAGQMGSEAQIFGRTEIAGTSDHPETKIEAPPVRANGDGGEALLREALSQASREVIERIAWEVIPTLAETIIREHVERLVRQREK